MRLAAYAGASTALAAGAVLRAFHERPNFYSASVYLAQSSACRMILVNFLLLSAGTLLFCLQRLLYGPLRAIEIEQLWERGWYTITETALAMTTFRDEVGVWFFVMFVCLLAGKVWGWISEGRVEMLEQQPPANPKLFHSRLIASLLLSQIFDLVMLQYCVRNLLEQPRPGMMVMFAFEYAVLAITSSSICARYGLSLNEIFVVKAQTKAKLEERREEIRAAREETEEEDRPLAVSATQGNPTLEDIDENDIDVPGWQEKGRWILFLDLLTDFLKLTVYVSFFSILIMFHGLPLHIIRDLYLTTRSFYKRINDYLKYRNATRDMNSRYPDASAEDLQRDGTCIICREDMRPWQQPEPARAPAPGVRRRPQLPTDERQRPKKLPCGHILHFGCLRSWLERQQVCPTCRRSVLVAGSSRNNGENQVRAEDANAAAARPGNLAQGQQPHNQQNHNNQNHNHNPNRNNHHQPLQRNQHRQQGQNDWRARTFNLGALRITFAAGNPQQFQDAIRQMQDQNGNQQNRPESGSTSRSTGNGSDTGLSEQIAAIETRIMEEIGRLNSAQEQLGGVRALQAELNRLRNLQANPAQRQTPAASAGPHPNPSGATFGAPPVSMLGMPHNPTLARHGAPYSAYQPREHYTSFQPPSLQQQILIGSAQASPLRSGDPGLPEGMTIPEGWSLLPLQRQSPYNPEALPHNSSSSVEELEVLGQVQPNEVVPEETEAARPAEVSSSTMPTSSPLRRTNATPINPHATKPEASTSTMDHTSGQEMNPQTSGNTTEGLETTLSIPDWSFTTARAASDDRQPHLQDETGEGTTHASDWETPDAHTGGEGRGNGSVNKDKGKGKAVTVEDDVDEENGL